MRTSSIGAKRICRSCGASRSSTTVSRAPIGLRTVMNRINPELFAACFSSWVAECWLDRPDLVAIDGKTSRRSHDRKNGQKGPHGTTPWAAIPTSPSRSSMPRPTTFWPVKDNQPTLHTDIKSYFDTAPSGELERFETLGKDHGRIEARTYKVSHVLSGWVFETTVATDPAIIFAALAPYRARLERVGHEAGAVAPRLHRELTAMGLPMVLNLCALSPQWHLINGGPGESGY
jgi:hypothetical protein